jgi:hypothetical protein
MPMSTQRQSPFALSPRSDWYCSYWYAPQARRSGIRLLADFITAIITNAMRLPADIRRAAAPCKRIGD